MTREISLNLVSGGVPPTLNISQYDVGVTLTINLVGTKPSGTPTVRGTKPSGKGFTVTASSSGNVITFVTTAAMTEECGRILAEVRFTNGSNIVGTSNFVIDVEESPHKNDVIDG